MESAALLLVVAGLLVLGGAGLLVVGLLGARQKLPRNRFAGVRTVHTLRDEQTFAVGNRVAAPLVISAGAVASLGGLAALAAPTGAVAVTLVTLAALGTVTLTVAGGVLGDRAARRVPLPSPVGCGGACSHCVSACGGNPSEQKTDVEGAAADARDS